MTLQRSGGGAEELGEELWSVELLLAFFFILQLLKGSPCEVCIELGGLILQLMEQSSNSFYISITLSSIPDLHSDEERKKSYEYLLNQKLFGQYEI